jgi:restriction endonuclease Mrr
MDQTVNFLNEITEWDRLMKAASVEAVRQACQEHRARLAQELLELRIAHHNAVFDDTPDGVQQD